MKKNVIGALVMLNVALLTTLVLRATANTAQAQGNVRRVGDVVMVPAQLPSGSSCGRPLLRDGGPRTACSMGCHAPRAGLG